MTSAKTPRQLDGEGRGKRGGGTMRKSGKADPDVEGAASGRVATSLDGAVEQDCMFHLKGSECHPNMEGSRR